MDRSSAQESYETPVQHASNVLELSAAFAFVSRLRLSDARFRRRVSFCWRPPSRPFGFGLCTCRSRIRPSAQQSVAFVSG